MKEKVKEKLPLGHKDDRSSTATATTTRDYKISGEGRCATTRRKEQWRRSKTSFLDTATRLRARTCVSSTTHAILYILVPFILCYIFTSAFVKCPIIYVVIYVHLFLLCTPGWAVPLVLCIN